MPTRTELNELYSKAHRLEQVIEERDALKAKLADMATPEQYHEVFSEVMELRIKMAAIEAQKPVAWMMASAMDDFKRGYIVEVSRNQEDSDDIPLYTALKSQEST